MKEQLSTFIIIREDVAMDPTTLASEGLKIGRAADCDLMLNHPTVSRLQAGIKEIRGRFYLFNLSGSNPTTLNRRVVATEDAEVLASGDELRVGPFSLRMDRQNDALQITVTEQIGMRIGEAEARDELSEAQPLARAAAPAASEFAQALDLFWGKRSREKAGRKSPLHPRRPPRLGKARFNWTPTRDLVRPWPAALFVWAIIALIPLSIAAAVLYTSAYAPAPVSPAHSRASFALSAAIAKRPNKGSCVSCHSVTGSMESNCESCHNTEMFASAVTRPHTDAAISCLNCHSEHKGKDFRPMQEALDSCTKCHNNLNKTTYRGKSVGTPHGGTFGYPVVGGQWVWKGLDPDELLERANIAALRLPTDSERQWRNKQFHALHLYRVKATGGVTGVSNPLGGSAPVLSCSSCHKAYSLTDVDRESPRSTCGQCHSGMTDPFGQTLVAAGAPNCVSCHVQHIKDKRHWNPALLVDMVKQAAGEK
jgi:hypothetical protein